MAGNHFKGSDSGRPAVPPRPNGAGKAGTPGGAGQGGSGKRVSPGETAMFTALYEQSQKAKKTALYIFRRTAFRYLKAIKNARKSFFPALTGLFQEKIHASLFRALG